MAWWRINERPTGTTLAVVWAETEALALIEMKRQLELKALAPAGYDVTPWEQARPLCPRCLEELPREGHLHEFVEDGVKWQVVATVLDGQVHSWKTRAEQQAPRRGRATSENPE